jgi:hypothetical protein
MTVRCSGVYERTLLKWNLKGLEIDNNADGTGLSPMEDITMWWTCRDSNSGPPACKADALPTELQAHIDVTNVTLD